MVTVTGYNVRKNKEGQEFITLELSGSLELIQSQTTGNFYATVRRCTIPSTFNEAVAQMMIGSKLDGEIVRVDCEPYDYTVKRTGEQITMAYSYAYKPAANRSPIGSGLVEIDEPEKAAFQPSKPAKLNSTSLREAAARRTAAKA